jgi:hypothetical protein
VPARHAAQEPVVALGPELGELPPEGPGDRLQQPRGALLEALSLRERPCDAVLHLESRGVALPLRAQAGDAHREQAADRHDAGADQVLAAAEGVRREPEHKRKHKGEHGHGGGGARRRAGRGDQRAGDQKLHEHHRGTGGELDHGHQCNRPECRKERAVAGEEIPPIRVRAQPGVRILR